MLALRDAIPRAMLLAEAWERELNGSMDGSWKSMAIDQREMESASTVFGEGQSPVLVRAKAARQALSGKRNRSDNPCWPGRSEGVNSQNAQSPSSWRIEGSSGPVGSTARRNVYSRTSGRVRQEGAEGVQICAQSWGTNAA